MTPQQCLLGCQVKLAKGGFYTGKLDAIYGPLTEAAWAAMVAAQDDDGNVGKLSSFADPADVAAFDACKANGGTDLYCFGFGDNGIGAWGDNTAQTHIAMCALPPEDIAARWGSVAAGKHKPVIVTHNGTECVCVLADLMPHKNNIHNGAVCDLNPAASQRLSLTPPFLVAGSWRWA